MKCYIATKSCGCTIGAITNDIDYEETLEEWKDKGYKIDLVDVEEARKLLAFCNHKQKEEKI